MSARSPKERNGDGQIDFNASPFAPPNAGPMGTTIKILNCPADLEWPLPPGFGGNNYFANYGTDVFFFQDTAGKEQDATATYLIDTTPRIVIVRNMMPSR